MTLFNSACERLAPAERHRLIVAGALLVIALVGFAPSAQALGPENTVVVVNADSWASTTIANEFVHARRIPAANVIYLSGLSNFERISVEEFREQILRPVRKTLAERDLLPQIDCVTYSADFPTTIDVSGDIAGRPLSPVITPQAAINGLTYLYELVLAKDTRYLDLSTNFYARRVVSPATDSAWSDEEQRKYAEAILRWQTASQLRRRARDPNAKQEEPAARDEREIEAAFSAAVDESVKTFRELAVVHPQSADLHYNLACGLAVTDHADAALAALTQAVNTGWWNYGHAARDDDFRALRARDEFKAQLTRMKAAKFSVQPTTAFTADTGWQANGDRAPAGQGSRYLLSTMLAYTSGRGNSVREAVAGLRRSATADGTRPKGTIYFLQNGDVRSTTREWAFARAVEQLNELGVAAAVLPGVLPHQKSDVAGAMIGSADFDWKSSGSTILPGAICEHLTSFGGILQAGSGQTPLTEFLRHGAAGASGTVTEPYALQAKFPTPHLHVHYAHGCSLAEAFYQSVTGPYQLLIVGDPLCKPWAKRMEVAADGLPANEPVAGMITITPRTSSPDGVLPESFELFVDGRRMLVAKSGDKMDWNTAQVGDGSHHVALVAYGSDLVRSSGRCDVSVVVRNRPFDFQVTAPKTRDVTWSQPLDLTSSLPGADELLWMHNQRVVARIQGASGTVSIDPRVFGAGPVRLVPLAKFSAGNREVFGQPFDFTVRPPSPLPSREPPAGTNLAAGCLVTIADRPAVVVTKTDGDWLAQSGVKPSDRFQLEGWFTVPDEDVYQFQLRGAVAMDALWIDETKQEWPAGREWHFVPVHLAAGQHVLRIEARAGEQPTLDLRFGGRGTQRMSGDQFRHPAAPELKR